MALFKRRCDPSGEKISRTVENVDGVESTCLARGGGAGGAGYFIAMWAAYSGSMNLLALILFESSRLLGFEAWYREHRS